MLSNPRWITIEGAGLSVCLGICLSVYLVLSGLVLSACSVYNTVLARSRARHDPSRDYPFFFISYSAYGVY